MLTDQDIQKLTSVLATKDEVSDIKEDTESLRESVQGILTSLDRLTKPLEDLRMEYVAVSEQLSRHERWIKEIAEKAGINLSP